MYLGFVAHLQVSADNVDSTILDNEDMSFIFGNLSFLFDFQ